MPFASLPPLFRDRVRLTRNGAALALTILVHLLLLLLFLLYRPAPLPVKREDALSTFSLTPDPAKKDAGDKQPTKEKELLQKAAPPAPSAVVPPVTPPVEKVEPEMPFITLNSRDFSASNLSNVPAQAKSGSGTDRSSAAVAGPGEGPGGVQLYNAEWYREPTDAEINPYLPARRPERGEVYLACKTIENYHVENCQVLREAPLGSGLGRAVRQASWQFLIRPERVNGKAMIGSQVMIHYTFTTINRPPGDQ